MALEHLINCQSREFISRVIMAMERIAPLKLADGTWDNVGLLVESPLSLNSRVVLVTNDLSSAVLEEAISKRAAMIISYHPPWFKAAKNIRLSGPLGKLGLCIANGISVYSPHTALDSINGGVNDWIGDAFKSLGFESSVPISPSPLLGFENCGFGRIVKLSRPTTVAVIAQLLKSHLGLKHLRLGLNRELRAEDEANVQTIALCAGSGGSVFTGVQADLFITGEMGHHQILELTDSMGAAVLLTEHSNCERGYLRDVFVPLLQAHLDEEGRDEVEVKFSLKDADPVEVI